MLSEIVQSKVANTAQRPILAGRLVKSLTHAAKPVRIDAALSRPAGAFIRRDGRMLRPIQDCARGYGGAVTFCRIDALGASEFVQTSVGRIRSRPFRCHTYNRHAGLEVIDPFVQIRGLQEVTISYVSLTPTRAQPLIPAHPEPKLVNLS